MNLFRKSEQVRVPRSVNPLAFEKNILDPLGRWRCPVKVSLHRHSRGSRAVGWQRGNRATSCDANKSTMLKCHATDSSVVRSYRTGPVKSVVRPEVRGRQMSEVIGVAVVRTRVVTSRYPVGTPGRKTRETKKKTKQICLRRNIRARTGRYL